MRVISGKYKRMSLDAPKGMTSRPTTDKIKETIFNILGPLEGVGLDLFAGSGGLGIEGISRGLDKVIFIDGSYQAIQTIKKNVAFITEPVEIYKNDYKRALKALNKRNIKFDIVFLDPPYNKQILDDVLPLLLSYDLLNTDARVLVECEKQEIVNTSGYDILKDENYGITKIMILGVCHE